MNFAKDKNDTHRMSHWIPSTPPGAGVSNPVSGVSSVAHVINTFGAVSSTSTYAPPPVSEGGYEAEYTQQYTNNQPLMEVELRQRVLEERERVVQEKEAIVKQMRTNAEQMKKEMQTAACFLEERERAVTERTEILQDREDSLHLTPHHIGVVPPTRATPSQQQQAEVIHTLQRQVDHLEAALGTERGERDSIGVLMQISSDFDSFKEAAAVQQGVQSAHIGGLTRDLEEMREEMMMKDAQLAAERLQANRLCEALLLVQTRAGSLAEHQASLHTAMKQAVTELSNLAAIVDEQQAELHVRSQRIQQLEQIVSRG